MLLWRNLGSNATNNEKNLIWILNKENLTSDLKSESSQTSFELFVKIVNFFTFFTFLL